MLVVGYLARYWWALVWQGVIAILFGVLAFFRPASPLSRWCSCSQFGRWQTASWP